MDGINMKGFEDLNVWLKSKQLAVKIYRSFQNNLDYTFKNQICRASLSIPSNIAEGYERNTPKEFIRFLNIAKGSCGELRTQLYIAKDLEYLNPQIADEFLKETRSIAAMLSGLIKTTSNKIA